MGEVLLLGRWINKAATAVTANEEVQVHWNYFDVIECILSTTHTESSLYADRRHDDNLILKLDLYLFLRSPEINSFLIFFLVYDYK